jgi:tetratricopeptide (TPR) repeat protein
MRIINSALSVLFLSSLVLSGCTKPGETTAISATTGGVVGAGMGAVVGAQTGDALTGAAIGAAMGALAGGAIGNALEAHEEVMQRQDEALERQQRIISSQQSEIQELRKIGQDTISFRAPGEPAPQRKVEERASAAPTIVVPRRLTQPEPVVSNNIWRQKEPTPVIKEPTTVIKSVGNVTTVTTPSALQQNLTPAQSADCVKADEEIAKAQVQEDVADKLFHYRRALRLCPTNPNHHNKIGELYMSLNRKDDARYEFGEALRLDPTNPIAKANMSRLGR